MDKIEIGKQIRERRKKLGLPVSVLAQALNYSEATIYNAEVGHKSSGSRVFTVALEYLDKCEQKDTRSDKSLEEIISKVLRANGLIKEKKKINVEFWVNVYADGEKMVCYTPAERDNVFSGDNTYEGRKIACLHIKQTVTEGDGL